MKSITNVTHSAGDIAIELPFENLGPVPQQLEALRFSDPTANIKPETLAKKNEALETAALIEKVDDPESQAMTVACVATLKAYTKSIEKSRKEVKAPFLAIGDAIDSVAKEATKTALPEITRLEKLLGGYQAQLDAAAEELRQQEEEARKQAELAVQSANEEEQQLRTRAASLFNEAIQLGGKAKTDKQKLHVSELRNQAHALVAEANEIAAARAAAAFQPAPAAPAPNLAPAIPTKPSGTINRKEWEVEVTDWNALYKAFGWRFIKPELNLQALKDYLSTPGLDTDNIPGIKAKLQTRVAVKAAK